MFDREEFVRNVENAHKLPGPFAIKVVCRNAPDVVKSVRAAVELACGGVAPEISERPTKSGRHVGLTVTARVADGAQVLTIYDELGAVDGVHMVI